MSKWGFKISFKEPLPAVSRRYLDADLNFFAAQLQMELFKQVEKFDRNREFKTKFLRIISNITHAPIDMNMMFTNIEMLNKISNELITYNIEDYDGLTSFTIMLDDRMFMVIDNISKLIPMYKMLGRIIPSRRGIMDRIVEETKKTYTTEFDITEIKEDDSNADKKN